MTLFDGRTPQARVEEAAFKAAWDSVEPLAGLALDDAAVERAWGQAFSAARAVADKAKPPLLEDIVRLHAGKGFRRALDSWYSDVQQRRDTRRGVIVETAHDAAEAMFARYESESEIRGNTDAVYEAALPQARWLNDGELALDAGPFSDAVYEGVVVAADERVDALCAQAEQAAAWNAARGSMRSERTGGSSTGSSAGGRGPAQDRAFELAVDVAREAAARALDDHDGAESPEAAEALAKDAAAAAVEALPEGMLGALDDDDQIDATLEGVARADAAPSPAGPAATARPSGGVFSRAAKAAASVGPAAGRAVAGVRPNASAAAAATARRARIERDRLALARRAKRAVDALLPEATGETIPAALSERLHAAAREAASAHNETLGTPFTVPEAARIADLTTTSILGTWLAVGHLRKSGLADKATAAARTSAARFLSGYGVPASVSEYLIAEAVDLATPGWAGGTGRAPTGARGGTGTRSATYRGRPVHDYYDVLQVSTKASSAVIDRAWRVLIAQSHPDQGGDPERAILLNEAHEVLLDAATRAAYDRENGL